MGRAFGPLSAEAFPHPGDRFRRGVVFRHQPEQRIVEPLLDGRIVDRLRLPRIGLVVIPLLASMPDVEIAKAYQTLNITAADIGGARDLGIPVNTPVADIRRVFTGPDGSVIYPGEATYRGDYIHLEMDLKP